VQALAIRRFSLLTVNIHEKIGACSINLPRPTAFIGVIGREAVAGGAAHMLLLHMKI